MNFSVLDQTTVSILSYTQFCEALKQITHKFFAGKFHIQVEHTDGKQTAGLTNFKAKLHEWIWVIVAFNVNKVCLFCMYYFSC